MRKKHQLAAIFTCMAAFGLSACSNDSAGSANPNEPGENCEYGALSCDGDAVVVCNEQGELTVQTDCAAQQKICKVTNDGAQCVDKPVDGKCVEGTFKCDDDGLNILRCDENGEFVVSESCDAESEQCVKDGEQFVCKTKTTDPDTDPEPTPECHAGETTCHGDVVWTCGDDGKWIDGTDCASAEDDNKICEIRDGSALCVAECTDGATKCGDSGVLTCAEGAYSESVACDETTEICKLVDNVAQCVAKDDPDPEPTPECHAGETTCHGDVVRTCGDDGKWIDGTDCASAEDDNKICEIRDGAAQCVAECTDGATKCGDSGVLTCAEGAYAESLACDETTEICKVIDNVAQCVAKDDTDPGDPVDPQCEAGQTKCEGTTVLSCNAKFQWEPGIDCSTNDGDDKNCVVTDGTAACSAVCSEGYSYCKDGVVYTCNDAGIFLEVQACDSETQICYDGGAGVASCQPKPTEPEPCPEGMVDSCSADGFLTYCDESGNIASKRCADLGESYICRTKDGVGECVEAQCKEGETKCDGTRRVVRCVNGELVTSFCKDIHDSTNFFCYEIGGIEDCFEYEESEQPKDSDGDTIPDVVEGRIINVDTDGDTVPDYLDLDSDGDTIPDAVEGYADDDGDGIPNFRDLDSDGNGIPDSYEGCRNPLFAFADGKWPTAKDINPTLGENDPALRCDTPVDTNGNGVPDFLDFDNDGDGIADIIEIRGQSLQSHTDPQTFSGECSGRGNRIGSPQDPVDCDGDGRPDYMSTDSDGDTLPDDLEGIVFKGDVYARYSTDTDKDGVPDAVEGKPLDALNPKLPDSDGDTLPDIISLDSDSDGLPDATEHKLEQQIPLCKGMNLRVNKDSDGDGHQDAAEYAVALASEGKYTPAEMVCNKNVDIKDVYKFYFELPYDDPKTKNDTLTFVPKVSKLDVVFNMDTTASMGYSVENLQKRIRDSIIPETRKRVSDSGFGVTAFDDFPTGSYGSGRDKPFILYGAVSTNPGIVQQNVNKYALHSGADTPESGYESLWQIVKGDDKSYPQVSWRGGQLYHCNPTSGTWGCAGFRQNTLPVVVHITDTKSHDADFSPYASYYVTNPHYSKDVYKAYNEKGARIMAIKQGGSMIDQLKAMATQTRASVPVCAFKTSATQWRCGTNKCCTTADSSGTAPQDGQCVLAYNTNSNASNLHTNIVDGLDALVKYSTYEVSTRIRGDNIGNGKNTSCFISKVEAIGYEAPPAEPEKSCNPQAIPAKIKIGSTTPSYNNGFTNFATGTSSIEKEGAKLKFKVHAVNNNCYKPGTETKVFTAYIDVYNPTTNLLFDTQEVAIVVPGIPEQANN